MERFETELARLIASSIELPSIERVQAARRRVKAAEGQRLETVTLEDLLTVLVSAPAPPATPSSRLGGQSIRMESLPDRSAGGSDGIWI